MDIFNWNCVHLHLRYCCLAWFELEFSIVLDIFEKTTLLQELNIMSMEKADIGLNLFWSVYFKHVFITNDIPQYSWC